jgi:Arc/MetJ-type ribon-helix-helix transcriptional regulator
MTTTCPACERESDTSWRCEHCGHDLVGIDDDDDPDAAPLVADGGMERVTFRASADQVEQLETLVERGEYPNRSEAMRTALRRLLAEDHTDYSDRLRDSDGNRLPRTDGGQVSDEMDQLIQDYLDDRDELQDATLVSHEHAIREFVSWLEEGDWR